MAVKLPIKRRLVNDNDVTYTYCDFYANICRLMSHHKTIDNLSFDVPDITTLKRPSFDSSKLPPDWAGSKLEAATRIKLDTIGADLWGRPFLFYVRHSLSEGNCVHLTKATKAFCKARTCHDTYSLY